MKNTAIIGVIVLSLLLVSGISAQTSIAESKEVKVYVFYGQGCPHCASLESFLYSYQEENPYLTIEKKEIYSNQENRELFEKLANAIPEYSARFLFEEAKIVVNNIINTAKAQGFIASTAAAAITAGIVKEVMILPSSFILFKGSSQSLILHLIISCLISSPKSLLYPAITLSPTNVVGTP